MQRATATEALPPQAFFQLYDKEDAEREVRPGPVMDPRPQERVQRHTLEHAIDDCPFVQILDAPVSQMRNQLLEVFRLLDTALPEQVIHVPKIPQDPIQYRIVDWDLHGRHTQMAEHLVEVPTVLSPSLLGEKFIDIPVPRGRRRVVEVCKVFSQYRIQQRLFLSRSLTFQFAVEDLVVFAPDRFQPRQLHCFALQMRRFKGFFALFREFKKGCSPPGGRVPESPRTRAHGRRRLMSQGSPRQRKRRRRTPTAGLMSTAANDRGREQSQGGGTSSALAWTWSSSGTSLVRVGFLGSDRVRLLLYGFSR